jgi:hypothetical protein
MVTSPAKERSGSRYTHHRDISRLIGRHLDHGQDAGLQGLGQVGPRFDHGGQIGVIRGGRRGATRGCALPLRCQRGDRFS